MKKNDFYFSIKGPQFILWTGCSVAECAAESLRGYGDLNEICCCRSINEGKNRYFWSIIKGLILKLWSIIKGLILKLWSIIQGLILKLWSIFKGPVLKHWLFGSTKSGHFGTFFHFLTLIRHVKSYQKIKLTLVYRHFSPKKWPELDNFFHFTLYWWLH